MDFAATPKKEEKVKLVRFSVSSESSSSLDSLLSPNTPSPTVSFTYSGRVSPRKHDIPFVSKPEKVKLVGFASAEKMNGNSTSSPEGHSQLSNPHVKEGFLSPKAEKERQERLSRLMQETQDWFSQMREENNKWKSGMPQCGSGSPSEKMKHFFEEAQEKFKVGNNELFSQFVRDNQDRFAQLLEESGMSSIFEPFPTRPSSMFFHPKQSPSADDSPSSPFVLNKNFGKGNNYCNSNGESKSVQSPSESVAFSNGDKNGVHYQSSSQSKILSSQNSSTCQSFAAMHSSAHASNGSVPFRSSCKPSHFSDTFPSFLNISTPTVNLSSPTTVIAGNVKPGVYQMQSSRSTFEYCGSTNTYRFSSEQVTQTFEHGYESISESEDEEEESVEDIASTVGEPSEYDDASVRDIDARSDSGCMLAIEYETKKDKIQQTLHKIATELLTTERTYVSILHLLDQVFGFRVDQENRAHAMFPQEVVAQMFTNVKSLYKLHHDFLLPQLEDRMKNWENNRRIGDIMKNFAPFLKMYTEYVKNYDNSMNLINLWYQKQQRFAQIMDEIHNLEECGNLTLQHHMLTPVQRVPRYQLLLKDYLKKLDEDSPDKPDTEKALELVSTAANHANESMKKIDKFKKLLEIQEMIGGVVDLVSPSRELLKEGKIIKISARSGDHQERYLFLFSDLLLLCSQRLIANRVVSGPCFRIRARIEVDGLVVEEGDNLETANTFYIRNTGRSIELYTPTHKEKMEWMEALAKAVHDLTLKKSSLRVSEQEKMSPDSLELGKRAPTYIKQDLITHCMCCESQFSTFTFKRKHHCHACGIVACNKCLSHKMHLPYEGSKQGRVCNKCYDALVKAQDKDIVDDSPKSADSPLRQKGILDVMPSDPAVVSGYLQLKARSRFWVQRWFSLLDDFVLYSFNSHLDEVALTAMPLPGYTVGLPDKSDNVDGRDNVFKLFHKKKVYYFQAANHTDLQKWVIALEKASRAESAS